MARSGGETSCWTAGCTSTGDPLLGAGAARTFPIPVNVRTSTAMAVSVPTREKIRYNRLMVNDFLLARVCWTVMGSPGNICTPSRSKLRPGETWRLFARHRIPATRCAISTRLQEKLTYQERAYHTGTDQYLQQEDLSLFYF